MKNYYIKPTIMVAEIEDSILAAGSPVGIGTGGNGGDALSKRPGQKIMVDEEELEEEFYDAEDEAQFI